MASAIHVDKAIQCVIQWIVLFSLVQLRWQGEQGSLRVTGTSQEEQVHTKPKGQNNVRLLLSPRKDMSYLFE